MWSPAAQRYSGGLDAETPRDSERKREGGNARQHRKVLLSEAGRRNEIPSGFFPGVYRLNQQMQTYYHNFCSEVGDKVDSRIPAVLEVRGGTQGSPTRNLGVW